MRNEDHSDREPRIPIQHPSSRARSKSAWRQTGLDTRHESQEVDKSEVTYQEEQPLNATGSHCLVEETEAAGEGDSRRS